jgi:hypothetical protein
MVVGDFNFVRVPLMPTETYLPLVVDANSGIGRGRQLRPQTWSQPTALTARMPPGTLTGIKEPEAGGNPERPRQCNRGRTPQTCHCSPCREREGRGK